MLFELARIFLRLGAVSFGGPLAHIALMRSEFVDKRGWLSEQEFLDLNGAVNLIPGPNSTELAMHIGYKRAGNAGLWLAGACFIFPALVLVLIFAALYAKFGQVPQSRAILWGIAPVVSAIVGQALLKFAPSALKNRFSQVVAILSFVAAMFGASEIAIVFSAALLGALLALLSTKNEGETPLFRSSKSKIAVVPILLATHSIGSTSAVFWSFLKIGSVIYGSGYVLLAYMRAEFVEKAALISDRQLLDAVAVGQMTPGPLFTSATFVGYQIGGLAGALAATAGIFLPSFLFVMLIARFLQRLSDSPRARTFLDSVNAASLALMTLVTLQLARAAFFRPEPLHWHQIDGQQLDFRATLIFGLAGVLLWKTRFNSAWWIAGGGLIGLIFGP
ncbi:chromate efflux transporter [Abditibacterium utsteinense]|nr:chromate efflux transporter [Abditibacterium utsteinense]